MDEVKETKKDFLLPTSILIAGVMISGSIIYIAGMEGAPKSGNQAPVPNSGASGIVQQVTETTERDVILGDPNAPVTLIEYGDFQCPFCARFHDTVGRAIREEYIQNGKVRMVFRNFQFLGPESVAAAEAAECAKDQKQFWAFHDAIYDEELLDGQEHNGNLNREFFLDVARDLKLDESAFASCVDGHVYTAHVQADLEAAQELGVDSTPTAFVNGKQLRGALPYAQFKQVIDEALQSV